MKPIVNFLLNFPRKFVDARNHGDTIGTFKQTALNLVFVCFLNINLIVFLNKAMFINIKAKHFDASSGMKNATKNYEQSLQVP